MATLKAITPQQINDITDRLRSINNYITNSLVEVQDAPTLTLLYLKRKLLEYAQKELNEVSKVITDKLKPVLDSATKNNTVLSLLTQIPTTPEQVVAYMPNLIQYLFGKQATNTISVLLSYAEPLMRLTAELQRTQGLVNSTIGTNSCFKVNTPDLQRIITDN